MKPLLLWAFGYLREERREAKAVVTVKVRYEDSLHHAHPSLQPNRRNGIEQFVKAALIRNFMY